MKKIHIVAWWLLTASLMLMAAFITGAWAMRHIEKGGNRLPEPAKAVVSNLAALPGLVKTAFEEVYSAVSGNPYALLIPKNKLVQPGWKHQFPAPSDSGYLLLSGLARQEKQSVVQLIRISDGHVVAKWVPNWQAIHQQVAHHRWGPKGNSVSYRAAHPQLLPDGSIVFNTGNSLVRQPLCSNTPSWVLPYPYHHSVELSENGGSVWVPSVTEVFYTSTPALQTNLRDDALAEISLEGKTLQHLSFSKILAENNLTAHLLGTTGFHINEDPIHINQISPATTSTAHWQRGDLLISARHLSTVYLYRPSSGKIIWHQQGPWLNQHSARFFRNSGIAVFGNNVYGAAVPTPFIYPEQHNQVYLHDFATGQTSPVHSNAMAELMPATFTEGRAELLDDMSLFVEETNNARLFKIAADGSLQWSYLNEYDETHLGMVSWSRYLTRQQLLEMVKPESLVCN